MTTQETIQVRIETENQIVTISEGVHMTFIDIDRDEGGFKRFIELALVGDKLLFIDEYTSPYAKKVQLALNLENGNYTIRLYYKLDSFEEYVKTDEKLLYSECVEVYEKVEECSTPELVTNSEEIELIEKIIDELLDKIEDSLKSIR